jgi:hypothetical protein
MILLSTSAYRFSVWKLLNLIIAYGSAAIFKIITKILFTVVFVLLQPINFLFQDAD